MRPFSKPLFSFSLLTLSCSSLLLQNGAIAQSVVQDPGVYGPPLELVHSYFDEWPTGIAVSNDGRLFSNYPLGLDASNTRYQVAELHDDDTETPYPSVEINTPPGGAVNYLTNPPTGANYPDHLIAVQSVVIDPKNRLWIVDTGRPLLPDGTQLTSTYGGPKLVGVNLATNSVFKTILFPPNVSYPESYPNDVRFDLRPGITDSGEGVAYLTDSSNEGRNGLIVVDLGTGVSWRHLDTHPSVSADNEFYLSIWGEPVYTNPGGGKPITPMLTGSDGITLSADGETLFYSAVSSRYLYSIPTAALRDHTSPSAELKALSSVRQLTQKGVSDGLESDSNGYVYGGSFETNSVNVYFPENGTVDTFVRDPRIEWTDTLSLGTDGYLYFTENQNWRRPGGWEGVDRRVKPYSLYRVPLPDGGKKIELV